MKLVSQDKGEASVQAQGDTSPLPADPCLLGKWRQPTQRGPGEKIRPQFGDHGAIARLRRRDRPQMPSPSGPSPASGVCWERRPGRGAEGGLHTSTFCPLSLPRAGRPPKCLLAWLLRVGSRQLWETPAQGEVGVAQVALAPPPQGQGLRQRQGPGVPPVATWSGGPRGKRCRASGAGRGGRRESGQEEEAGLVAAPRSSSHNSHRSQGWMEAHTHCHKHRQTDRQTDVRTEAARGTESASAMGQGARCRLSTLGDPPQPRSPRPGQTTSRGEYGRPAG